MQHRGRVGAVARDQRDADAAADIDRHGLLQVIGLPDAVDDPVGKPPDILIAVQPHQQHELITADPAGLGARRLERLQAFGHLLEQRVAGAVAIGIVDRLEAVQVQVQHRELRLVLAGPAHRLVQRAQQAVAVQQAGQRILPRLALVLPLGQHGRHQHAVQPVRGHRHRSHVERHLHQHQPENRLLGEQGRQRAGAHAQRHHRRRQPWRAEIAHADAADHRGGRQAGQRRRDPVAADQADEGAVAHAAGPEQRQHHVQVGRGRPVGKRRAPRRHQHHDAGGADQRFHRQPQQERRLGAPQRDQRRHQQGIDDAAKEDRQGSEQAAHQRHADIRRHVAAGVDQPPREPQGGYAVNPVLDVHSFVKWEGRARRHWRHLACPYGLAAL